MKRALSLLLLTALAACSGVKSLPAGAPAGASDLPSSAASTPANLRLTSRAPLASPVGSSNTVTADMPVPRPDTKPCTVTLFTHYAFKNFNNQTFSFSEPKACPGPWAKVVFNFDVSTSKGVQFDRTAIIWLGGAPIFFGTTAEPSPNLAPYWHVERDVTDLSALFKGTSQGQIALGNCYCPPTYTGILYGTAKVQFYPPDSKYPAPRVPDVVLGLPSDPPLGNASTMPKQAMTIDTKLPQNIVGAYLDVYLQSQHDEEQWFMCTATTVFEQSGKELGFCPNTPFREGVVAIDGIPAGTSPIYPWIYTGGLDPYLWAPIPGVQTLEFTPYRVNVTPFAGLLDDGNAHKIGVNVTHSFDYFTGTGDLLLYLDPKASKVTGKVLYDSLATKAPVSVSSNVRYSSKGGLFGGKAASGPVRVTSSRDYRITGELQTSSGLVRTTVAVDSTFSNDTQFDYTGTGYSQIVAQETKRHTVVTTKSGKTVTTATSDDDYPLNVAYPISQTKKGFALPIAIYQGYSRSENDTGATPFSSTLNNTVVSKDTMLFDAKFNWIGVANGASLQLFTYKDSTGICYGGQLTSKNNVVASSSSPSCTTAPPKRP